jgi:UDP-2,3-diacylglucosamine hydrolase
VPEPSEIQRIIVVADAHLGQVPAATEAAFHAFLDRVPRPGDHLLINGDLFDFWFEYGAVIPRKHFVSVAKLQSVRARGIPITFVGGNHDRWGGDFLRKDLGIAFHGGETELELLGRRAFVAHGDGFTEQHWSAQLMHRVTRHPLTIWTFRHLHPDLGFWIAGKLSGTLADNTKDRAVLDRAAEAQRAWAADLLGRRPDLDLVIMAHTHYAIMTRHGIDLRQFTDG